MYERETSNLSIRPLIVTPVKASFPGHKVVCGFVKKVDFSEKDREFRDRRTKDTNGLSD